MRPPNPYTPDSAPRAASLPCDQRFPPTPYLPTGGVTMPRSALALALLLCLALAACGGGGSSSVALPQFKMEGNRAKASVSSMAEGEAVCDQVQADWPEKLSSVDQRWLDVPGTGSHTSYCGKCQADYEQQKSSALQ